MARHWGLQGRLRLSASTTLLIIGLLIVLASGGLAACGYQGAQQGNASPVSTRLPTQETQTPVSVQKCGNVQGSGFLKVPVADSDAAQVENCFWQAFQHCKPATLIFSEVNIDTALIRTFTIHNTNGACSIEDAKQLRVLPNPPGRTQIYTCANLLQQQNSLHFFSCGVDGDIVVPGP